MARTSRTLLLLFATLAALALIATHLVAPTADATREGGRDAAPDAVAGAFVPAGPAPLSGAGAAAAVPETDPTGAAAAPPAGSAPVHGRVLDPSGAPVAGATVAAFATRPSVALFASELPIIAASRLPARPAAEDCTAADGTFAFAGLRPGSYTLVARHGGLVAATVRGVDPTAADGRRLELRLGVGHTLRGELSASDGRSAAGVPVVAFRFLEGAGDMPRVDTNLFDRVLTRTDEHGAFALVGLEEGAWSVMAIPDAAGGSEMELVSVPMAEPVRLTLRGGATLTGHVTDDVGAPVASARVLFARLSGGWFGGYDLGCGSSATLTDAAGGFELRGLLEDDVGDLVVDADGFALHKERVHGPDATWQREIALERGATVRGTVRAWGTTTPVAGVLVWVRSRPGPSVTTGEDGRYEIGGVPAGRTQVLAQHPGWTQVGLPEFVRQNLLPQRDGAEPLPLMQDLEVEIAVPSDVVRLDLALFRPALIRGRVLVPGGSTAAGFPVIVGPRGMADPHAAWNSEWGMAALFAGWEFAGGDRFKCGVDGRFEVSSPAPGGSVDVWTYVPQLDGWMLDRIEIAAGEALPELQFRVPEPASISGRVTDASGLPLADTGVTWSCVAVDADAAPRFSGSGRTVSDAEGRYAFPGVPPCRIRLAVRVESARTAQVVREVDLQPGTSARDVELRAAPLLAIAGRVVRGDGRTPGYGVSVELRTEDSDEVLSTESVDEFGRFRVGELAPGRYRIRVTSVVSGARSATRTVAAGDEDVLVTFSPGMAIRGRVEYDDGRPVAGANVWAEEGPELRPWNQYAVAGEGGDFCLDGLAEGAYVLSVARGESGPAANIRPVTIHGVLAGSRDVRIRVREGLVVRGTVRFADGGEVPDGQISCRPISETNGLWAQSSTAEVRAGRFEFAGLDAGPHELRLEIPGAAQTAHVVESGGAEVALRAFRPATLRGEVVFDGPDIEGFVSAGVWDELTEGCTRTRGGASAAGFEISGVGPGVHTVVVVAEEFGIPREGEHERRLEGRLESVRVREGDVLEGLRVVLREVE